MFSITWNYSFVKASQNGEHLKFAQNRSVALCHLRSFELIN